MNLDGYRESLRGGPGPPPLARTWWCWVLPGRVRLRVSCLLGHKRANEIHDFFRDAMAILGRQPASFMPMPWRLMVAAGHPTIDRLSLYVDAENRISAVGPFDDLVSPLSPDSWPQIKAIGLTSTIQAALDLRILQKENLPYWVG